MTVLTLTKASDFEALIIHPGCFGKIFQKRTGIVILTVFATSSEFLLNYL